MKMILAMMVLTAVTAVGQTTSKPVENPCSFEHIENCIGGRDPDFQKPAPTSHGQIFVSKEWHYAVSFESQTGTVVKLSDEEYARLQKLRQAVVDAEIEIAKAHGVYFAPIHCYVESATCPHPESRFGFTTCDRVDGCPERPTDRYQFRGQFLLINLPKAAK